MRRFAHHLGAIMHRATRTPRRLLVLAAVALVLSGIGVGIAVDRVAIAQQPAIKRTILQRADEPGAPNYEAVMGISEIAPGGTSGRHRHPGIELAYVLDGSVVVEHDGKPPITVSAGQALKNEAEVHNATNKGSKPVKILAVYLVEKGKPLAESVP
jgi:quercetin dioxygenase-like cupin family protein